MGDMSYQGGIGGFVFACPKGSVKTKLYGSTEQFPSILFQVLQEIETEGYVTREIYVDTHSVNLSKAAEEVAAMFRVCLIPVSAGTPQEMAYAESAVRVIGQMGRTLMCGAPHLLAISCKPETGIQMQFIDLWKSERWSRVREDDASCSHTSM